MKIFVSRLSFPVCGIVAVIAVASGAPAALADDGPPAVIDPSAIVAAATTATDPAVVTDGVTVSLPADPTQASSNPVVPTVSPSIPPAIPATSVIDSSPPPTPSPDATVANAPLPAAPAQDSPAPQITPQPAPTVAAPTPAATPADTTNITPDNFSGIAGTATTTTATIPSPTFVWNWDWNCDTSDIQAPPANAGATTLVWNWHWSCADSRPVPLDVVGTTICVSCNIAVSLRIASPGDTGAITQTIAAQTLATVAAVGAAVQQGAQVPVAPDVAAALPVPPAADPPVTTDAPTNLAQFPFDDGPARLPAAPLEDAPLHGGEALSASWSAVQSQVRAIRYRVALSRVFPSDAQLASSAPPPAIVEQSVVREPAGRQRAPATAGSVSTPHPPFPPPAPGDETPSTVVALSPVGLQHPAGSSLIALAIGALGLILFLFCSYLVPLTRFARTRPSGARPHPPG